MSNQFLNDFQKDKEEVSKKSEWYKFQEGDNKIRILETPVKFFETFNQKFGYLQLWHDCGLTGSMKYLTRAWLNGKDGGQLVLIKIPMSVMDLIVGLMTSEEYAFSDFPMPYNINIKATNAGTKEVKYAIVADRNNSDVPVEAQEALKDQNKLEDILEKMKEKSKKKWEEQGNKTVEEDNIEYPNDDINPEDIPF